MGNKVAEMNDTTNTVLRPYWGRAKAASTDCIHISMGLSVVTVWVKLGKH
jgi:hypothetical protein